MGEDDPALIGRGDALRRPAGQQGGQAAGDRGDPRGFRGDGPRSARRAGDGAGAALALALMGAVNAVATAAACLPAILWWAMHRPSRTWARLAAWWLPLSAAVCVWWAVPLVHTAHTLAAVKNASALGYTSEFMVMYTSLDPFNANAYTDRIMAQGTAESLAARNSKSAKYFES